MSSIVSEQWEELQGFKQENCRIGFAFAEFAVHLSISRADDE